jgi:hypothetical protein
MAYIDDANCIYQGVGCGLNARNMDGAFKSKTNSWYCFNCLKLLCPNLNHVHAITTCRLEIWPDDA